MEEQLEQKNLDASFSAAQKGIGDADKDSVNVEALEVYDFGRAGQINHEQMRSIGTVNHLFARSLKRTMAAWLRMECDARLVASEQLPFGDFVDRLGKPMYVCSMRLEPFEALGLMEIDLALALPVVDILLGGTGEAAESRDLTDIEESIVGGLVQKILQELNRAWQPVGLQMAQERRETEDQIERMMTPLDKTLCVSFELRAAKATGMLNLCFPASVLNSILRRMAAEGGRPRRRQNESRQRMLELMGEAKVEAVLQFPPLRLRARELAELVPGSVLRLPLQQHADAELRIDGLALGRAYPVRLGEHRGAQLVGAESPAQKPVEESVA